MQTLTVLPQMGVLSWIIISAFVLVNGLILIWAYRNWQSSEEKNSNTYKLSEKEKQYQEFTDITGYYFIPRERFIYLHSQVIRACFNIWMKGVLTFEDWHHIQDYFFYSPKSHELNIYTDFRLCQKLFKYHRNNKMIFPSDKFLQVFFGFGEYYEQVLNENKK